MKKWLAEGGSSNDPEVRKKAYSAAIQRITEQAYWLPLHTYVTTYGYAKALDFTPYADELPRFYPGEVEVAMRAVRSLPRLRGRVGEGVSATALQLIGIVHS